VRLDVIATEGEINVKRNMDRKESLAATMFDAIIGFMNQALTVNVQKASKYTEIPTWMSRIS
jgi:glycerol-3-phosphate acyltransferase PlsY